MGVRILLDGPARDPARRLGRAVAVTASVPLLLVGVIGLVVLGYLVVMLVTNSVARSDQSRAAGYTAWAVVAAVLGLWLGLRLLRGRRRTILFLRRFGYVDATQAVSFAAVTALGGAWRLVTFDDELATGVGGRTAPRRASGFGIVFVLAAVAVFVLWFIRTGGNRLFNTVLASLHTTSGGSGDPDLDKIGTTLGAGLIVGLLMFIIGVLLIAITGVSVPILLFSYFRARRAERSKTARIRSAGEISGRVASLVRRGSRILAPRLVVVTVAHPVWQHAVHAFGHSVAAVIIDVSIPSESLRWEINTLLPVLGNRCVLVGRLDLLTRQLPDGRTVISSPFAGEIDGQEILAYRSDRPGLRRFARALRSTVEARVSH